eukprot:scaffold47820_cov63-Attheya_sp.AAC.1
MHNDKKTAEEFVAHNVKQTPDHNSEKDIFVFLVAGLPNVDIFSWTTVIIQHHALMYFLQTLLQTNVCCKTFFKHKKACTIDDRRQTRVLDDENAGATSARFERQGHSAMTTIQQYAKWQTRILWGRIDQESCCEVRGGRRRSNKSTPEARKKA